MFAFQCLVVHVFRCCLQQGGSRAGFVVSGSLPRYGYWEWSATFSFESAHTPTWCRSCKPARALEPCTHIFKVTWTTQWGLCSALGVPGGWGQAGSSFTFVSEPLPGLLYAGGTDKIMTSLSCRLLGTYQRRWWRGWSGQHARCSICGIESCGIRHIVAICRRPNCSPLHTSTAALGAEEHLWSEGPSNTKNSNAAQKSWPVASQSSEGWLSPTFSPEM